MAAAKLLGVSPILLVRDMNESVAFWRDRMGFDGISLFGDPPTFALVERDRVTIMLALVAPSVTITPNWRLCDKTSNLYLFVDDARSLYEDVQRRGAPIDFTLYETPWGCLEFGVQDPNGYDISVGQVLKQVPP